MGFLIYIYKLPELALGLISGFVKISLSKSYSRVENPIKPWPFLGGEFPRVFSADNWYLTRDISVGASGKEKISAKPNLLQPVAGHRVKKKNLALIEWEYVLECAGRHGNDGMIFSLAG